MEMGSGRTSCPPGRPATRSPQASGARRRAPVAGPIPRRKSLSTSSPPRELLKDYPMRRRLPCLLLLALAAPSSTALADHPATYKGRFDFATVDVQPVSATEVFVRGRLAGNETLLGRFTGEVE